MLLETIVSLVWNPYTQLCLATLISIILLIWIYEEWIENAIRNRCKQQNLRYVRVPSQMLEIMLNKRYDLIENELIDKNGLVFGGNKDNALTVILAQPELVHIVCSKEFTKFVDRRRFKGVDPLFQNMLFVANGEQWKRLRAVITPAFSAGKMRKVKFVIDETAQAMIDHFETMMAKDSVVDVKKLIGIYAMDTIIQMAYGVKVDSLRDPTNQMAKMATKMFGEDISIKSLFFFLFAEVCPIIIKLLGLRFHGDVIDFFEKYALEIIQKKRQELKSKSGPPQKASNFIELVLEVEQEQAEEHEQKANGDSSINKPFKCEDQKDYLEQILLALIIFFDTDITNDELVAQCIIFFTVGYDTISNTVSFVLYSLASNPEKQEKLYQSIVETLNKIKEEDSTGMNPFELITFDNLNKFEYLSAVVDESMRLNTVANAVERTAAEDLRIETSDKKTWFDVKRDDIVRVVISHMHHNPNYFSNPYKYVPERFLPNNDSGETCDKHAFMPFGVGPRNCVAKFLGLFETKMALIHLVRLFRFEVCKETKLEYFVNVDTNMLKNLYLKIEKRN